MIGDKIRELREGENILLRQLAAQLDMDTALLSKMERGDRLFRKEDIIELAKIFHQSQEELLTLWLADKILKTTEGEAYIPQALSLALQTYNKNHSI
ncbi:helix-turn-helix domain-containing protein [Echinicola marina]|uniref:helix-turn-helix domain-containing protein n=1 Tax=Echinicola marina TaxID=2859768 RepID=UPI001CF6DBDB|nr:helix-turn-helix transcriptional regulator [Echinicola marina]UCS92500.1 helix-turn-helix domain-containing protein [Echinicola marina]